MHDAPPPPPPRAGPGRGGAEEGGGGGSSQPGSLLASCRAYLSSLLSVFCAACTEVVWKCDCCRLSLRADHGPNGSCHKAAWHLLQPGAARHSQAVFHFCLEPQGPQSKVASPLTMRFRDTLHGCQKLVQSDLSNGPSYLSSVNVEIHDQVLTTTTAPPSSHWANSTLAGHCKPEEGHPG